MYKHQLLFLSLIAILFITSCSSETEEMEPTPEPITIEGRYAGQWSSEAANGSVYTGIPISAIISPSVNDSTYTGNFFFTSSFVSCCGSGNSDGPISLTIRDNQIVAFEYQDVLPNCNGNFQGSGTVSNNGRLTIQFTGADCEGEHTNASMFFSKL